MIAVVTQVLQLEQVERAGGAHLVGPAVAPVLADEVAAQVETPRQPLLPAHAPVQVARRLQAALVGVVDAADGAAQHAAVVAVKEVRALLPELAGQQPEVGRVIEQPDASRELHVRQEAGSPRG